MNRFPDYRLYLDETGDHSMNGSTVLGQRYLGLVGVMISRWEWETTTQALEALKASYFPNEDPDEPVVLHREDIIGRRGPFSCLNDPDKRRNFDSDLLKFFKELDCHIFAVVIDKVTHRQKKYRNLVHPYHYCVEAMLERYVGLLRYRGVTGDVVAESRGGGEDRELKKAYRRFWEQGSYFTNAETAQRRLTSKEIKIKPKCQNIAGLQIADLLAHPLTRDVLVERMLIEDHGSPFAAEIAALIEPKYNRRYDTGRIAGYGRIWLD